MRVWFRNFIIVILAITIFSITVMAISETNLLSSPERSSPSDWIKENQILVTNDKVILNVLNPIWAKFTDTN